MGCQGRTSSGIMEGVDPLLLPETRLMADKTLLLLLDDVRGKTLSELQGLDDPHARWAPPGLRNSCLWHAGHAYVVTEFLTQRSLGRAPQMPESWMKMFSWESNPAHVPADHWPSLEDVVAQLKQQYERLRGTIASLTDAEPSEELLEQLDKLYTQPVRDKLSF